MRTLNLLSTLSTSSPSAGVQLGGGLLITPPPMGPPSVVEPSATLQRASSAALVGVWFWKRYDTPGWGESPSMCCEACGKGEGPRSFASLA